MYNLIPPKFLNQTAQGLHEQPAASKYQKICHGKWLSLWLSSLRIISMDDIHSLPHASRGRATLSFWQVFIHENLMNIYFLDLQGLNGNIEEITLTTRLKAFTMQPNKSPRTKISIFQYLVSPAHVYETYGQN